MFQYFFVRFLENDMVRKEDLFEEVPELNYILTGKGEYTFILESGLGDSSRIWGVSVTEQESDSVASKLEKFGRVFRYDRLGEGKSPDLLTSDPIPAIQTVMRLHNFLVKKEIKPPYILVGHSIGGLYMQEFAKKFPEEVAGVILIDSCVGSQMTASGWEREIPKKYSTKTYCCFLKKQKIKADYCEVIAQKQHASDIPFPKEIPLDVISAKYHTWGSETNKKQMDIWHKELAKQSQIGVWKEADKSFVEYQEHPEIAHYPHFFEPDLVVQSVERILELNKTLAKNMLHQFKYEPHVQSESGSSLSHRNKKISQ